MTDSEICRIVDPGEVPLPFGDAYAYWDNKRGRNVAPAWADFHLDDIDPRLIPWSVVVDVVGNDLFYRFWGSERAKLIGLELTHKFASQIPHDEMREANIAEYMRTVTEKGPLLFNTLIAKRSGIIARFQSIRLPISDDGVSVTKVFSAINYEQITDTHYDIMGTSRRQLGLGNQVCR